MNKIITIIAIALLTTTINAQEKNQKPTLNPAAQKPTDTSPIKKPKPTQAPPTPQKEEDKNQTISLY